MSTRRANINATEAINIMKHGGKIRRPHWPPGKFLAGTMQIFPEDQAALDFVETEDSAAVIDPADDPQLTALAGLLEQVPSIIKPGNQEPVLSPPSFLKEKANMTQVQVKKSAEIEFACKIGNTPAEFIMATEITVSDPASAVVVEGEKCEVYGIKEAAGLTLNVKGLAKDKDGNGVVVEGVSNPFDVIPAAVEMVPELNADGTPKMELDANGNPVVDEATGQPKIKLIPAAPELAVTVTA